MQSLEGAGGHFFRPIGASWLLVWEIGGSIDFILLLFEDFSCAAFKEGLALVIGGSLKSCSIQVKK